ncbi:PP2C family protein-serine/threonine phosphatase [Rheinheimera sp. MMS21-TC3]|uniref:PP2C family protein-serine/threonine phosphatase n=1 Tax=Rheinheimera sp. MMS21-TC3 TaxID=3072790 RepID=UPI0028C4B693|nr:protein phosphatase 2C domain-containing protein [Rheinheimera sp. MMS21-TC3]WNO60992.1 protein phosphatase 2C domain-containing protein [Rheinheimera sp. MMS21-TC3]
MSHIVSHTQSHKGLVRKINEDACVDLYDAGVWVVADGMGGHAAGDVASQLVVETISSVVKRCQQVSVRVLTEALHQANKELCHYSEQELNGNTAGSTVVILLVDKFHYHFLWVGDSRGYILRDNVLRQLTRDHSQVNEMVEQGLLDSSEAESHELANVITRAVGVDNHVSVDVVSGVWQPGDLFLLCTDGLNKELSDSEIKQYLNNNIADANKALLHSTLVAGARDNVTTILVKLADQNNVNGKDVTIPKYLKL